jgi:tetratricopeptide (TPR) repeat protein
MGDMKQAYALCDGALQQTGQSGYRWLVRGEIMVAAGKDVDRHCFDKAQQLEEDWLVPLEAARIDLFYQRPSKALIRIRRALDLAPDAPYVWFIQGTCQAQLGLRNAAQESFRYCLELSPRHADAEEQLRRLQKWSWSPIKMFRRLLGR